MLDKFSFEDGGRSLVLTHDAPWGVDVLGRPEAATVERIVVSMGVGEIAGIWSPLFGTFTGSSFGGKASRSRLARSLVFGSRR
jgi:hypothetical protein